MTDGRPGLVIAYGALDAHALLRAEAARSHQVSPAGTDSASIWYLVPGLFLVGAGAGTVLGQRSSSV